ncbi:MAG: endo alpha-1,4 polygalactosaminidase [Actinobacteria bacterium]|nr:endo alpha-1,4 polygalactosaminidase [Actinomycetota bacterium]
MRASGRHAICYLSAGSWEDWRSDAGAFPDRVKGRPLSGWQGERWLDTRALKVLLPIMGTRMDVCKAKGFEAVDPDNVDRYENGTGFSLTKADSTAYLRALLSLAHQRGLSIPSDAERGQGRPAHRVQGTDQQGLCGPAGAPLDHLEESRPGRRHPRPVPTSTATRPRPSPPRAQHSGAL